MEIAIVHIDIDSDRLIEFNNTLFEYKLMWKSELFDNSSDEAIVDIYGETVNMDRFFENALFPMVILTRIDENKYENKRIN